VRQPDEITDPAAAVQAAAESMVFLPALLLLDQPPLCVQRTGRPPAAGGTRRPAEKPARTTGHFAGQRPHQGRFAGAVGPDDRQCSPGVDAQDVPARICRSSPEG